MPGVGGPGSNPRKQERGPSVERVRDELDAEKARAEALTNELASTKRAAEAERAAAHALLDDERARSAALLRDLARLRERIARAFHDRLLEIAKRGAEDEASVGERIRHAAGPQAGDGALSVAVRLGVGLPSADRPDGAGDPDQGRRQSSGSAPDGNAGAPARLSPASAEVPSAWASLPQKIEAHVTVAYARGSEPARKRALALSDALQAEGIDVAVPVDAPSPARGGRVTYYYGTDRADAERVAALCAAPSPFRARVPALGRLPRPGTIGVAVAD